MHVYTGFNIGSTSSGGAQSSPSNAAGSTNAAATSVGSGQTAASVKPVMSSSRRDINQDVCNVPGFTVLQWLLSQHPHIPHVYFMMMGLLVGQPVQQLPQDVQVCCMLFLWSLLQGAVSQTPFSHCSVLLRSISMYVEHY